MAKTWSWSRFARRPAALAATVLLVIAGIMLGNWQAGRAQQKLALQAQLAQAARLPPRALDGASLAHGAPPEYSQVRLRGRFVDWPLALNNRPHQGQAGFYLVMPLRLADSGMHVLVARGWLPRNMADPRQLPPFQTPAGEVVIDGMVVGTLGHIMQLGTAEPLRPGAIVQNLTPAQFAQASGLATAPFFIEQAGTQADGLLRDWPAPALGVERNQGYAFQWYALAAMAALFFIVTGIRRARKPQ